MHIPPTQPSFRDRWVRVATTHVGGSDIEVLPGLVGAPLNVAVNVAFGERL